MIKEKKCQQCGRKYIYSMINICDECIKQLGSNFFMDLDFLKTLEENNEAEKTDL